MSHIVCVWGGGGGGGKQGGVKFSKHRASLSSKLLNTIPQFNRTSELK